MGRRKKSKKKIPVRDMITEYEGWKTGDTCYTVFGGESKPSVCEVIEFHPGDCVTPSVSVVEVSTGKYRTAALMAIADSAKEAKNLAPGWREWYDKYKTKQAKLERARRKALAEQNREAEQKEVTE